MKHLLLASSLLLSSTAFAADWTPAFRYLEAGKSGDGGAMLSAIMNNTFSKAIYDYDDGKLPKQPLTKMAASGKFTAIKAPYRNDMLPAKSYYGKDDLFLTAVYPLKNAKLYGYPLENLTYYWGCTGCGHVGFYATFKPMTNAQYNALIKSVKFKQETEGDGCWGIGEPLANFTRQGNVTQLHLTMGC